MNYLAQNKTPEELLQAVGFKPAPDRGYQIVLKKNSRKEDPSDYRSMIPKVRLHAVYFERQINIHYDGADKRRPNRHRANQRHIYVLDMLHKIKQVDEEKEIAMMPETKEAVRQEMYHLLGGIGLRLDKFTHDKIKDLMLRHDAAESKEDLKDRRFRRELMELLESDYGNASNKPKTDPMYHDYQTRASVVKYLLNWAAAWSNKEVVEKK